jgi:hypothetical protein
VCVNKFPATLRAAVEEGGGSDFPGGVEAEDLFSTPVVVLDADSIPGDWDVSIWIVSTVDIRFDIGRGGDTAGVDAFAGTASVACVVTDAGVGTIVLSMVAD